MDSHGNAQWQRGDARKIMKEARRKFRERTRISEYDILGDPYTLKLPGAQPYVDLASTHWALVKRYRESTTPLWLRHLAVWHAWRAVVHAKKALSSVAHPNEADVVSRILMKSPWWIGGNSELAFGLVYYTLNGPERWHGNPHTRALLLCTSAQFLADKGKFDEALENYTEAVGLKDEILAEEDQVHAKQQLVRIFRDAGMFMYDHHDELDCYDGYEYLHLALELSREHSHDQHEHITDELLKRGITAEEIEKDL